MTVVTINEKDCLLKVEGHTGYMAKGYDIVCSSVSTLVQYIVCALGHAGLLLDCEMADGKAAITYKDRMTSQVIVYAYKTMMQALQAEYPNNISIVWGSECSE